MKTSKSQRTQPVSGGRGRKFDLEAKGEFVKPKRDTIELVKARALKVDAALERWTRKENIAHRRVQKLKKQQRYYQQKLTASPAT